MAWDPINETELNPGYNILKHVRQAWNCLKYLYGTIGTLATDAVVNGSFEVDSDADGMPDNWTKTLYSGGSVAIDSSNNVHGEKCIKIVHPGGGGNGGGYIESDYKMVSPNRTSIINWIHWATAAGMKNIVEARYYTAGKVFISSETLYTSTSNPTTPTFFVAGLTVPSTARYVKLRLTGGYNDTNVAGTAYFDAVDEGLRFDAFQAPLSSTPWTISSQSTSSASWVDAASVTVSVGRISNLPLRFVFSATLNTVGSSGSTGYMRFRIGVTNFSNEASLDPATPDTGFSFTLVGPATNRSVTIYMQIKSSGGGSISGKKLDSACSCQFWPFTA